MKKLTYKKFISFITAVLVILTPLGSFSSGDTAGHWAEKALNEFTDKEILKGYEGGNVLPDLHISRAELIALINRTFEYKLTSAAGFADIESGDWFYADVAKAVKELSKAGFSSAEIRKVKQDVMTQIFEEFMGELEAELRPDILRQLRASREGLAIWKKHKVTLIYVYKDKNGIEVMRINFDHKDY